MFAGGPRGAPPPPAQDVFISHECVNVTERLEGKHVDDVRALKRGRRAAALPSGGESFREVLCLAGALTPDGPSDRGAVAPVRTAVVVSLGPEHTSHWTDAGPAGCCRPCLVS